MTFTFLLLKNLLLFWFPQTKFYIYDGIPNLRQRRDALGSPTSSPAGLKPVAMQPDPWIPTLGLLWLACDQHWSFTVRHNDAQWSLERTMAPLVLNVCDSVSLLTADRGDGQARTRHSACTNTRGRQTHTHTQTDLRCSWPCRHTEAPTQPPWWGRPVGAKAKEHRVSVLGEHLWPPPTHTNTNGLYERTHTYTHTQRKRPTYRQGWFIQQHPHTDGYKHNNI